MVNGNKDLERDLYDFLSNSLQISHWGVTLSALFISAIFFLTIVNNVCSLTVTVWFAAHITVYSIIHMVLCYYARIKPNRPGKCDTGSGWLFFVVILLLIAWAAAAGFLIFVIVDLVNLGCVGIPACNTSYAAFVAIVVLVILYLILVAILILYIGFYVKSNISEYVNSQVLPVSNKYSSRKSRNSQRNQHNDVVLRRNNKKYDDNDY